jgi:hypothetical protein
VPSKIQNKKSPNPRPYYGLTGARALLSGALEISIRPEKGRPNSRMRKIADAAESAQTNNAATTIALGRANSPKTDENNCEPKHRHRQERHGDSAVRLRKEPAKFDADEYAPNLLRSGYAAAVGGIVIVAVGAYYGRHDRNGRRHVIGWRCYDYDAVGHAVAVWTPVSAEPTKPTHLYDVRRGHLGSERARKSLGTERKSRSRHAARQD